MDDPKPPCKVFPLYGAGSGGTFSSNAANINHLPADLSSINFARMSLQLPPSDWVEANEGSNTQPSGKSPDARQHYLSSKKEVREAIVKTMLLAYYQRRDDEELANLVNILCSAGFEDENIVGAVEILDEAELQKIKPWPTAAIARRIMGVLSLVLAEIPDEIEKLLMQQPDLKKCLELIDDLCKKHVGEIISAILEKRVEEGGEAADGTLPEALAPLLAFTEPGDKAAVTDILQSLGNVKYVDAIATMVGKSMAKPVETFLAEARNAMEEKFASSIQSRKSIQQLLALDSPAPQPRALNLGVPLVQSRISARGARTQGSISFAPNAETQADPFSISSFKPSAVAPSPLSQSFSKEVVKNESSSVFTTASHPNGVQSTQSLAQTSSGRLVTRFRAKELKVGASDESFNWWLIRLVREPTGLDELFLSPTPGAGDILSYFSEVAGFAKVFVFQPNGAWMDVTESFYKLDGTVVHPHPRYASSGPYHLTWKRAGSVLPAYVKNISGKAKKDLVPLTGVAELAMGFAKLTDKLSTPESATVDGDNSARSGAAAT